MQRVLPRAPLVVGLWPADDSVLADERLRAALGADHYVTSLRDAVSACLEAVQATGNCAPVAALPAEVPSAA